MTETLTPNEPLIREVLSFIKIHPERWNQNHYLKVGECGTIGCFMGWAAILGTNTSLEQIDEEGFGALLDRRRLPIAAMLGLSDWDFREIYGFTSLMYYDEYGLVVSRPPTFAELCEKVEQVTGIKFKPEVDL